MTSFTKLIQSSAKGTVVNPPVTKIKRVAVAIDGLPPHRFMHMSIELADGKTLGLSRQSAGNEMLTLAMMFRDMADGIEKELVKFPLDGA